MTQLGLALGDGTPPVPATRIKRTPKPHHRPKADGPLLPIKPRYLPVVGTPGVRSACPDTTEGHCVFVRCRFHLARIDAEDRAGRPGLSNVPRDARGLTQAVEGELGSEGAGTTLMPRWLELERSAKVAVRIDEQGQVVEVEADQPLSERDQARWVLNDRRIGTLDTMLPWLRVGEPIDVYNDNGVRTCGAQLMADGSLKFDAKPDGVVVTLVRRRGVESCALDAVKRRGKLSNHETGECLDRHRTLVAREARGAARKAARMAAEMGIDEQDFRLALLGMGSSDGY